MFGVDQIRIYSLKIPEPRNGNGAARGHANASQAASAATIDFQSSSILPAFSR
jgi:hypothetical protein